MGLRLITIFTGDSTNNEEDLTIFLREVYALSATSNLTDYILKKGGHNNVTMAHVVALLEKKSQNCVKAAIAFVCTTCKTQLSFALLQLITFVCNTTIYNFFLKPSL